MKNNNGSKASQPRQKTLGWYLSGELLEKTGSPSPPITTKAELAAAAIVPKEEKKRKRGGRRGRKMTESTASDSDCDATAKPAPEAAGGKDDFWYYDVASDGYYYEQNGAKGWRRRLPNGVQPKNKLAGPMITAGEPKGTAPFPAGNGPQVIPSLFGQQSYRYYDAASDGFFYEMASVDGWKKRQPASAPRQTPRSSQSYGAVLARGEMPANCVVDHSSASSSVSDDMVDHLLSGGPYDDPLAPLSRPEAPLSRPEYLNLNELNERALFDFNADKFIEDLVGQFSSEHLEHLDVRTPKTPEGSRWQKRWATPQADEAYLLQKDLEKIWLASP